MGKVVRFQDLGPDVLKLQLALSKLGFSPGPLDGKFGFLTEEALVAFQLTYGLKPDAVAGAALWRTIAQRELPLLQFPQQLPSIDALPKLEAQYNLRTGTLSQANILGPRWRGQSIFIPQRRVLALWDPQSEPEPLLEQTSILALWGWRWGEAFKWRGEEELASLIIPQRPCLAAFKLEDWGFLAKKKDWPKRVTSLCRGVSKNSMQGLLVELVEGGGRWRRRLVMFFKLLAQELAQKGHSLYLKLPARLGEEPTIDSNWSLDYRALGDIVNFVVVDFSRGREGYSFSHWQEASLRYLKKVIPPWKLLLQVSSTYSTGETKQLLSAEDREQLAEVVLFQKLGGLALVAGERLPQKKYFVVEGTL
jgi:hypothetical protein